MPHRWTFRLIVTAGAILFATVGACRCEEVPVDSNSDDEADGSEAAAQAQAPSTEADAGGSGSVEPAEEPPPEDLYPGTKFGQLSEGQRRTFVDIAKQEVCPCPETPSSLHRCLQEQKTSCGLARRAAKVIRRGLGRGIAREDILSTLAKYMEKAKKRHDFDLESAPRKGPEDAEVRIVEFADFQCPACKRASGALERILKKHDDVALYFKHYPLPMHDKANLAARAAYAAQQQGEFWSIYELLFSNQKSLSKEKIVGFARQLGMNVQKFESTLESDAAKERVDEDKSEGSGAGVGGTPAIFIDGRRYIGPVRAQAMTEMIEAARGGAEASTDEE